MNSELTSSTFRQNPYSVYTKLREESPICKVRFPDGQIGWLVTRYKEAVTVLKDDRFIKDASKLYGGNMNTYTVFMHNMLFSDPPDHKKLRGLVQKAFTPRMIAGMRERIQEITDELLDQMKEKNAVDLIDEFAFQLPIIVICEMLGVPAADRNQFRVWSNSLIEGPDGNQAGSLFQHMNEFIAYLQHWFEKVRANPGKDLIGQLIQAEENGDHLTERELYGVVTLLIIAGHETTVNLIGNTMLALFEFPDQLFLLSEQPQFISAVIEESLRFNSPVEFSTSRWAAENLEINGQQIQRGDLIIVSLNAANHDPDQFKNPEIFNITREKSQHLAFGTGIHLCLGAPLARLEGEIAVLSLLRAFPHIKLAVSKNKLNWRQGMIVRGVKELPVLLK